MNQNNGVDSTKEEAQKKEQEIFSKVINTFLRKNKFHSGALAMGLGGLIIVASILSLISFWIPFVCGICIIGNALPKFLMGVKTDLSELEKKVLILIKLETVISSLKDDSN